MFFAPLFRFGLPLKRGAPDSSSNSATGSSSPASSEEVLQKRAKRFGVNAVAVGGNEVGLTCEPKDFY